MNNEIDWYAKNNLTPTGKVIILKDNERVISKWSYYIFQTLIALGVFQGLLRLGAWIAS